MKRMTATGAPEAIPTKQSLTDGQTLVNAETEMANAKALSSKGGSPTVINQTSVNNVGGDTNMMTPSITRNPSAQPNNNILQP